MSSEAIRKALDSFVREHRPEAQPKHAFGKGDVVALRVDPGKVGTIIEQVPAASGVPRYRVFHGPSDTRLYAEDQLVVAKPQAAPEQTAARGARALRAALTAYRILHPASESLYSLRAARVQHVPFQYKPLIRLLRSDRPRILVADEVGVGKTIEAGLLLRELEARQGLENILIVCPKALTQKWRAEMRRFDQNFVCLSSQELRSAIKEAHLDGTWHPRYSRIIVSLEALRRDEVLRGADETTPIGLLTLNPPPKFDLVIVDEAHHLRNPVSNSYEVAEFLGEISEALVLLSATPIQLGSHDLFHLLRLLRPELFLDIEGFEDMLEPNKFLNSATSQVRGQVPRAGWQKLAAADWSNAGGTTWGRRVLANDPRYRQWLSRLSEPKELSREERVRFLRDAEDLHSLAHVVNRTRRRDIGNFTIREPNTVSIAFTPAQQDVYERLIRFRQHLLGLRYQPNIVKLISDTLERQASSCLPALAATMDSLLARNARLLAGVTDTEEEESEGAGNVALPPELRAEADALRNAAAALPPDDPKANQLESIVRDIMAAAGPRKVLVFSFFLHTLGYLRARLANAGLRVAVISGSVPDHEREVLRDRFRLAHADPKAIDVLLSSEVGCEGLDYEFCDTLVNYDIPWNPMRLEQRIGRIDRFGQRSPKVRILNFVTPGTVEERIYFRCFDRIGVFHRSLGDLEAILGEVVEALGALPLARDLTPQQAQEQAEQVADNALRRLQEDERFEEASADFLSFDHLIKTEMELLEQPGRYIAPADLRFMLEAYAKGLDPSATVREVADEAGVLELQVSEEARAQMLRDVSAGVRGFSGQDARRWLDGRGAKRFTLEQQVALQRRAVEFLTPLHPVARAAATRHAHGGEILGAMESAHPTLRPGSYVFAIDEWTHKAAKPEVSLNVRAWDLEARREAPEVAAQAWELMRTAVDAEAEPAATDDVETAAHALIEANDMARRTAVDKLRQSNHQIVEARRANLDAYYNRLIEKATQEAASSDSRIRVMKEAQAVRLGLRRGEQMEALRRMDSADILSNRVALIQVHVTGAKRNGA